MDERDTEFEQRYDDDVPLEKRIQFDLARMFREWVPVLKQRGKSAIYDPRASYTTHAANKGLVLLKPTDATVQESRWPPDTEELLLLSVYKSTLNCANAQGRHVELSHHGKDYRLVDDYQELWAVNNQ